METALATSIQPPIRPQPGRRGGTTVCAARRSAASAAQRQRPILAAPCQWPPIGQIDSAARCTPCRPLLSSLTLRPLLLRLLDGRRNRMLGTVPQPDTFTNRIECFPLFLLAISPSESISFFRQISRLRTSLRKGAGIAFKIFVPRSIVFSITLALDKISKRSRRTRERTSEA